MYIIIYYNGVPWFGAAIIWVMLSLIAYCGSSELLIPHFQIGVVTSIIYKRDSETHIAISQLLFEPQGFWWHLSI